MDHVGLNSNSSLSGLWSNGLEKEYISHLSHNAMCDLYLAKFDYRMKQPTLSPLFFGHGLSSGERKILLLFSPYVRDIVILHSNSSTNSQSVQFNQSSSIHPVVL